MRNKLRFDGIAISFFAAVGVTTIPLVIYGLTITSHSTGPKFPYLRTLKANKRKSLTSTYSKSNDFKEIDINDVLLEAENAMKIAEISLVIDDSNVPQLAKAPQRTSEYKDINIDGVLLEAKNAMKVAQTSIVDKGTTSNENYGESYDQEKVFATIKDYVTSEDVEDKTSVDVIEILSSTIGGILLGSMLGSVFSFKLFDSRGLDLSTNNAEVAILIASGSFLGGITGLAGSCQDNQIGMIVRSVLGVPTKTLTFAMVKSIQEGARRQLDKTKDDIKSIPSSVTDFAKQSVTQKAKETKLALDLAMESSIERAKTLLLVVTMLSSLVVVGVLIANGELKIG